MTAPPPAARSPAASPHPAAAGGRGRVVQADIADRDVSAPLDGDFAKALLAIGGEQPQIPALPPLAAHQAAGAPGWGALRP